MAEDQSVTVAETEALRREVERLRDETELRMLDHLQRAGEMDIETLRHRSLGDRTMTTDEQDRQGAID